MLNPVDEKIEKITGQQCFKYRNLHPIYHWLECEAITYNFSGTEDKNLTWLLIFQKHFGHFWVLWRCYGPLKNYGGMQSHSTSAQHMLIWAFDMASHKSTCVYVSGYVSGCVCNYGRLGICVCVCVCVCVGVSSCVYVCVCSCKYVDVYVGVTVDM